MLKTQPHNTESGTGYSTCQNDKAALKYQEFQSVLIIETSSHTTWLFFSQFLWYFFSCNFFLDYSCFQSKPHHKLRGFSLHSPSLFSIFSAWYLDYDPGFSVTFWYQTSWVIWGSRGCIAVIRTITLELSETIFCWLRWGLRLSRLTHSEQDNSEMTCDRFY